MFLTWYNYNGLSKATFLTGGNHPLGFNGGFLSHGGTAIARWRVYFMEHPKIPRMMTGGTPLLGNLQILTKKSTWGLNFNHFMGIFTGTYNPKLMILACIFGLSTVSTHWFPGSQIMTTPVQQPRWKKIWSLHELLSWIDLLFQISKYSAINIWAFWVSVTIWGWKALCEEIAT